MKDKRFVVSMDRKDDVVIVSGVRTPFSRFGSVLREMHSMELGYCCHQSLPGAVRAERQRSG